MYVKLTDAFERTRLFEPHNSRVTYIDDAVAGHACTEIDYIEVLERALPVYIKDNNIILWTGGEYLVTDRVFVHNSSMWYIDMDNILQCIPLMNRDNLGQILGFVSKDPHYNEERIIGILEYWGYNVQDKKVCVY